MSDVTERVARALWNENQATWASDNDEPGTEQPWAEAIEGDRAFYMSEATDLLKYLIAEGLSITAPVVAHPIENCRDNGTWTAPGYEPPPPGMAFVGRGSCLPPRDPNAIDTPGGSDSQIGEDH